MEVCKFWQPKTHETLNCGHLKTSRDKVGRQHLFVIIVHIISLNNHICSPNPIVCSFFLTIEEINNMTALRLYCHVDYIGKQTPDNMSSYLSNRHAQGMHNRCYFAFNKYIGVGVPRIFHPRPAPFMTGPTIYHGSIVSAQIRCTRYNMFLPRTLQWTKLTV